MAPVTVSVNVVYNEAAASSSVPPSLLLKLPLLPPELSYGFVGLAAPASRAWPTERERTSD
jgi:hypothetical protein